jgi:hypothetical protein
MTNTAPTTAEGPLGPAADGVAALAEIITKVYGGGDAKVIALNEVTIGIPRGRFTAIVGKDGKVVGGQGMTRLGGDWTADTGSELRIVSGSPPRAADDVVIDSVSAGKGGLKVGDQVKILTQGPTRTMRISGIFALGSLNGLDITYALFTPEVASYYPMRRSRVPQPRIGGVGIGDERRHVDGGRTAWSHSLHGPPM